jgi:hypothetical protein
MKARGIRLAGWSRCHWQEARRRVILGGRVFGHTAGGHVTQPLEEQRWYQRRKFWFASGILADRRTGVDRRTGDERRRPDAAMAAPLVARERRNGPTRRAEAERRSAERRLIDRRPLS